MNFNRAILASVIVLLSVVSAWAGGPQTVVTFNDITGTVGIANGGTGQTASSAALAALGGFPSAGGTIAGKTALGTGNTAFKVKIIYGTTPSATGSDTAPIATGVPANTVISISGAVNYTANGWITGTYPDAAFEFGFVMGNENILLHTGASAVSILSKPFTCCIVYVE